MGEDRLQYPQNPCVCMVGSVIDAVALSALNTHFRDGA